MQPYGGAAKKRWRRGGSACARGSFHHHCHRGDPVVKMTPVTEPSQLTLEQRVAELERQGILIPAQNPQASLEAVAQAPGALERFLAERAEE